MDITSFFKRHWQLFALVLFSATIMLLCPDAVAQSSSLPMVNRFVKYVAGAFPPDVIIPLFSLAFVICALTWWRGKMEGGTLFVIFLGCLIAGGSSYLASTAVSLGAG